MPIASTEIGQLVLQALEDSTAITDVAGIRYALVFLGQRVRTPPNDSVATRVFLIEERQAEFSEGERHDLYRKLGGPGGDCLYQPLRHRRAEGAGTGAAREHQYTQMISLTWKRR
jgi:hypothetical protein